MDEEEDDDDANPFENLSDCMCSMTTDEANEMINSFDLYMQQRQHHVDHNAATHGPERLVVTEPPFAPTGMQQSPIGTPEAPWSLKKWLRFRPTSSASVDGIHWNNGFEPDPYTLDGLRKELFAV
jgi:hypothetical protein